LLSIEWLGDRGRAAGFLSRLLREGVAFPAKGAAVVVLSDGRCYPALSPESRLIVLEGADAAARRAAAAAALPAVTVGLTGSDGVTYSSLGKDSCLVAVERPFLSLAGLTVEEQEIALPCPGDGVLLLLKAAAALALGVPAAQLPSLLC